MKKKLSNEQLRNAMAEEGYEMTPQELQDTMESIVRKIYPELLDTMSVEDAMAVIATMLKPRPTDEQPE